MKNIKNINPFFFNVKNETKYVFKTITEITSKEL